MTLTRRSLIDTCRRWIGTPFHHQGRAPLIGLDCIGPYVCAMDEHQTPLDDVDAYSRQPNVDLFLSELERQLIRVPNPPERELEPGDLMYMWVRDAKTPTHIALVTDYNDGLGMLHAFQHRGAGGSVVEHELTDKWLRRIHSVFVHPAFT